MLMRIQVIKREERSRKVSFLHAAMKALGLDVDPAEVEERRAGETTITLVEEFQKRAGITPVGEALVDRPTAEAMNQYLHSQGLSVAADVSLHVRGVVTGTDGRPVRGLTVTAYDRDWRKLSALGQATTNAVGEYLIAYQPEQVRSAERGTADIVVTVETAAGELLHTGDTLFNAPEKAVVNVALRQASTQPEFEAMLAELRPLLDDQDLAFADLEEDDETHDLTFAAGETGLPAERLRSFALAWRLGEKAGADPRFWYAILRCEGLVVPPDPKAGLRPPLAAEVERLLAQTGSTPIDRIVGALDQAVAQGAIAKPADADRKAWLDRYREIAGEHGERAGAAAAVAGLTGLKGAKRDAIAAAWLEGGDRKAVLERLAGTKGMSAADLDHVETSLAVHEMVLGDVALAQGLRAGVKAPAEVAGLARLTPRDWRAAIDRARTEPPAYIAGDTAAARKDNYAALLAKRAADAHPTAAFAGGLQRGLEAGRKARRPALGQAKAVLGFLDAHPDFDLASTSVDGYLRRQREAGRAGAGEPLDAAAVADLKAAQRTFKLVRNYEGTNSLLADGVHSAQHIYRMGRARFVRRYQDRPGFEARTAEQAWQRAANTHAAAMTIVGELRATQNANAVSGLNNVAPVIEDIPNLANLFGKADVCACEECRSIFSPSAYLADLMTFLEARDSEVGAPPRSVRALLFDRRPDIGEVELSCENSHTELPYIDLACEVLEDQVAPWVLFNLAGGLAGVLVEGPVHANVVAAFAGANPSIALTGEARVSVQQAGQAWTLHDVAATYGLKTGVGGIKVSLLRQTRVSAEEAAASPEYVNQAAYDLLRGAARPLALPFDLYSETARGFLSRVGASRWELMETFRGPVAPNNPTDLDIAAEHLGIAKTNLGVHEQSLIFTPDPAHQFSYWGGGDNPGALAAMARVDVFLDRTGLEYVDLQALLTLRFINPGAPGDVLQIQHLDDSCDLNMKRIQGLTAEALDRIHRFLRLQRKLGWTAFETDLVVRHPALGATAGPAGAIDATLAQRLHPFLKLKARFPSLSVEQACALLGPLNTAGRFVEAFKPLKPSLYESLFLNPRLSKPLDPALAVDKVSAAAPPETIDAHLPPVLAALHVGEADLTVFRSLTKPANAGAYIDAKLSLGNLSFLYRHATLARLLKFKAADWKTLLFLAQQDVFATPAGLWLFLELADRVKACGLTLDQIAYILSGDRTAKAAEAERTVLANLSALRAALKTIAAATDPAAIAADEESLVTALTGQLQSLGWGPEDAQAAADTLTGRQVLRVAAVGVAAAFDFPAAILNDPLMAGTGLSIDGAGRTISFTGVMTVAQQTLLTTSPALAAVTGVPGYLTAIQELFDLPRRLIKLIQPRLRAALPTLPLGLGAIADPRLAARVSYDADARQLVFFGIMSDDDKAALDARSADAAYRAAVLSLYNQGRGGGFPAEALWLTAADLTYPLADHAVDNLKLAETRLLASLRRSLSRAEAAAQMATALRLTPALAEQVLARFRLFGAPAVPLIETYTDPAFVASDAAITTAAFPNLTDGYWWLHRLSLALRGLAVTVDELDWVLRNHAAAAVSDLQALPLKFDPAVPAAAPLAPLADLAEVLARDHATATEDHSLLAVMDRLINDAGYPRAQFAADVFVLTDWPAKDVERLAQANALDIAFPVAWRSAAGWRRLDRAMALLRRLNSSADKVLVLARPVLSAAETAALTGMLRARYEEADWLQLSKEVQDALRERKQAALVAYLLTQPAPADAPHGRWQTADDLYAYYLIDVQMCSCMISSRIVQASAAVQLFVQRCFMGLEPQVRVSIEEDDGWKQWQWMKYYRVWEANRRVFAYPEDFALPELRRDKSQIFDAFEQELLQKEVNKDNVETAFLHFVQKLDDISQLEIAGTYYQDNIRTLHVFGRTPGTEPRLYYYRTFVDNRRWTPWTKLDCEIQSDFVTPFVVNERLHLTWTEFRDEPEPPGTVDTPAASQHNVVLQKPAKKMNVFLAMSELRSGEWTPKRVSQTPFHQVTYNTAVFDRSHYLIMPLDFTFIPGGEYLLLIYDNASGYQGLFQLAGCRGYPEPRGGLAFTPVITRFDRDALLNGKNVETDGDGYLIPRMNTFLQEPILFKTPDQFRISYPQYMSYFDKLTAAIYAIAYALYEAKGFSASSQERRYVTLGSFYNFFYADKLRTFFVRPALVSNTDGTMLFYEDVVEIWNTLLGFIAAGDWAGLAATLRTFSPAEYRTQVLFQVFYHPLTCLFAKQLYAKGVEGLMARETQFADKGLKFFDTYGPTPAVIPDFPREVVDFDGDGAYAQYNWELFFHAPLTVAMRLSDNQRFEDAMRWFHFIFDPTGGHANDPVTHAPVAAPQKYWITKPFFERQSADYLQQRIENLMRLLADDPAHPTDPVLLQELRRQVQDWRRNPFDPHLIAQFRTVAYQKLTVMKYIDNLVAWGDQRFRAGTLESVNEAAQLYVLAAEILGPKPRKVSPAAKPKVETFNELAGSLDAFSNAIVDFENLVPPMPDGDDGGGDPPQAPTLLYFCIPQNDQLLAYWDKVADRLYKVRHCLDIDGVARQLSLFAPPIDPLALVRATAGGADVASALADLDAPLPPYRFAAILQKANEVVSDVKALGGALLAALEKKDAEALSLLRQSHELTVLAAVRDVKLKQIDDALLALDGVKKSRELIDIRRKYYESRLFIDPGEGLALGLSGASAAIEAGVAVGYILSGGLKLVPDFLIGAAGFGGTPTASGQTGGHSFGDSAEDAVQTLSSIARALDKGASLASTLAGYVRRQQDWDHQANMARKELEQADKQIASAVLKIDIAKTELRNHDLQVENAKAVDEFMHRKYTNQELYQWMQARISQTYFQSYQLAYDLAKRAERCFRYELGVEQTSYIQFGYWDGLHSGLQAGERLQYDLRRLDAAWLAQNRRELECAKHVSLAMLAPEALMALKDTGSCVVELPEELFDLDYPGHYFRRIKTVSLSVPCVAGPYTTVNCTLRLLKNSIRVDSGLGGQYAHNSEDGAPSDDPRFRESHVQVKSIAASSGQNDSGLFELNFRDERYLPFEGAGAISTWRIELMADKALRQFDYDTISDVVLHLRYTARENAGPFKDAAVQHLRDVAQNVLGVLPLGRLFDLKREFAPAWHALFHPAGGGDKRLSLALTRQHFPHLAQDATIQVEEIALFVRTDTTEALVARLDPPVGSAAGDELTLAETTDARAYHVATKTGLAVELDEAVPWVLKLRKDGDGFNDLTEDQVEEAYMVVRYSLQPVV